MDIQTQIKALSPWYHTIELPDGSFTPGKSDVQSKFKIMEPYIKGSLKGCTVLDLGCNAGGLTFEFAKRGATVVGVEKTYHYFQQANFLKSLFDLDVNFVNIPVYEVQSLGTFDYVLFLGLLYHLRYPMLALDIIHSCCQRQIFLNQKISKSDDTSMDLVCDSYTFVNEQQKATGNWWFTSEKCTVAMTQLAGFTQVQTISISKQAQNMWLTGIPSTQKIQLPKYY